MIQADWQAIIGRACPCSKMIRLGNMWPEHHVGRRPPVRIGLALRDTKRDQGRRRPADGEFRRNGRNRRRQFAHQIAAQQILRDANVLYIPGKAAANALVGSSVGCTRAANKSIMSASIDLLKLRSSGKSSMLRVKHDRPNQMAFEISLCMSVIVDDRCIDSSQRKCQDANPIKFSPESTTQQSESEDQCQTKAICTTSTDTFAMDVKRSSFRET